MNKLIWLPRLILLLQIGFFGIFSFSKDLKTMLILLIPVYILTAILLISFKSPLIASILTFIAILVFAIFFTTYEYYLKFLVITLPQLIAFILLTIITIFTNKTIEDPELEEEETESYIDMEDTFHKFR
ncbi:MAG: hypothetical protein L0Y48_05095 [Fusobacteria bacterium]|nr:hypothetical protein [Fusobacteriota bacterium]